MSARPVKSREKESCVIAKKIHALLHDPTKMAKLQNLPASISQYNGRLVHPKGSAEEGFTVHLTLDGKLQLTVQLHQLEVVTNFDYDHAKARREQEGLGAGCKGPTQMHGSVRNVFKSVSTQLRRSLLSEMPRHERKSMSSVQASDAIRGKMRDTIANAFDRDHDGTITHSELAHALKEHNIFLSVADVQLIWKTLDSKGTGEVDMLGFADIITSAMPGSPPPAPPSPVVVRAPMLCV